MSIYFDHAATTSILPNAREAYLDALGVLGNPSSIHGDGRKSRQLLEDARERIAVQVGCDPIEVIFTSGGTESINLAIKGSYFAGRDAGKRRILVPRAEHHATIDAVEWLEFSQGAEIEWLPVDEFGAISSKVFDEVLSKSDDWALATSIWANNEVGTIQPIAELAEIAKEHSVPFHVDAVGAFKHLSIDFKTLGLTALSISSHKIGGPPGVGALILDRKAKLTPLIHGGGQERKLRSGTQDVPGAFAFAVAAEAEPVDLRKLRDRLIVGIRHAIPQARLMGDPETRLDSNAHFVFPGAQGDSLLFLLDQEGISASTGSACQAGVPEVSHVLLAMGLTEADAAGALRFTLGHDSTDQEVDRLLEVLPRIYEKARNAGLSNRDVKLKA